MFSVLQTNQFLLDLFIRVLHITTIYIWTRIVYLWNLFQIQVIGLLPLVVLLLIISRWGGDLRLDFPCRHLWIQVVEETMGRVINPQLPGPASKIIHKLNLYLTNSKKTCWQLRTYKIIIHLLVPILSFSLSHLSSFVSSFHPIRVVISFTSSHA